MPPYNPRIGELIDRVPCGLSGRLRRQYRYDAQKAHSGPKEAWTDPNRDVESYGRLLPDLQGLAVWAAGHVRLSSPLRRAAPNASRDSPEAVEAGMKTLFKNIVAGGIGLLKWVVGLIALAVVGILVYRLYAPAQWRCLLDTGAYIFAVGEPSGEWVEDRDGTLYPRDRIQQCVDMAQ